MRISPHKTGNLLIVVFVFGIVLFIVNVNDNSKGLRYQLNELYETEFDSCLLTSVHLNRAREFASRDDYSTFSIDCSKKSYPILLDDSDKRDLFNSGNRITKRRKSLDLLISDDTNIYKIRLQDPENMDSRRFAIGVILAFMVFLVALILILPNSVFDPNG